MVNKNTKTTPTYVKSEPQARGGTYVPPCVILIETHHRKLLAMSVQSECLDVEASLERALWEPLHEWESRVKFVEDHFKSHGMEKSIHLSLLWANMNFLGCKYPGHAEALVSQYPPPSMDELEERRSRRPKKRMLEDGSSRDSEGIDGRPDSKTSKTGPSRAEVSALISSIRSQAESCPSPDSGNPKAIMGDIETMASKTCLCEKCLGKVDGTTSKAIRIMERYSPICSGPFVHTFTFSECVGGLMCSLDINGMVVIERTGLAKKDSKAAVATELVQRLEEWQESNQLPPCAHVPKQAPPQKPYNDQPYTSHFQQQPYVNESYRQQHQPYQQQYGGHPQQSHGSSYTPQQPYGGHSQQYYGNRSHPGPKDNSRYMPPSRGRGNPQGRGGYRDGYY